MKHTIVTTLVILGLAASAAASQADQTWTRQFGTSAPEEAHGVALDAAGNAYVAGWTFGTLPDQISAGTVDAFLVKFDPLGNVAWTRQFGSWERDFARAVATDGAGNAYVVGETHGVLPGQASAGGFDAFVRKYDPQGNEVWTCQFGGGGGESAWDVAADAAGNAYVAGTTGAALRGGVPAGGWDAFVRKYSPEGSETWTHQFGGPGGEGARGLALGPDGVLVVGSTDLALPGQSSAGGYDAFLRHLSPEGLEMWTRQFGGEADDYGMGVAVGADGRPSMVGSTDRTLPQQSSAGGSDAFLRHFDDTGTALWTQQFGTSSADDAWDVAVDSTGDVYVVGNTEKFFAGQNSAGKSDMYLRRYDPDGVERSTRQFGTSEQDLAFSLGLDPAGHPRVVGSTRGTLPGQASAGDRDAFVIN